MKAITAAAAGLQRTNEPEAEATPTIGTSGGAGGTTPGSGWTGIAWVCFLRCPRSSCSLSAIVSVFFVAHSSAHFDANARYINDWLPMEVPPLLWLNTAVLLLSSVTIEIARRHMFREQHVMEEWLGLGKPISRRAMPWVAATVVLGVMFLVGQVVAWKQLATQRISYNTGPSAHSFFLFTGVHGLHLVLGVGGLIAAFVALFASKQMENRQIFVDLAAWYWHSMGLALAWAVWAAGLRAVRLRLVVLFALLASTGAYGQGLQPVPGNRGPGPGQNAAGVSPRHRGDDGGGGGGVCRDARGG